MCVRVEGGGERERECVCVRVRGGGDLILTLHLATHSALERVADILSHLSAVLAGYALKAFSRNCRGGGGREGVLKYEQFVCMCTYETLIKCLRELSTL